MGDFLGGLNMVLDSPLITVLLFIGAKGKKVCCIQFHILGFRRTARGKVAKAISRQRKKRARRARLNRARRALRCLDGNSLVNWTFVHLLAFNISS